MQGKALRSIFIRPYIPPHLFYRTPDSPVTGLRRSRTLLCSWRRTLASGRWGQTRGDRKRSWGRHSRVASCPCSCAVQQVRWLERTPKSTACGWVRLGFLHGYKDLHMRGAGDDISLYCYGGYFDVIVDGTFGGVLSKGVNEAGIRAFYPSVSAHVKLTISSKCLRSMLMKYLQTPHFCGVLITPSTLPCYLRRYLFTKPQEIQSLRGSSFVFAMISLPSPGLWWERGLFQHRKWWRAFLSEEVQDVFVLSIRKPNSLEFLFLIQG